MGCSFLMAHGSQPKPIRGEKTKIERDEIEIDPRKKRNPLGHIKQHFEGKLNLGCKMPIGVSKMSLGFSYRYSAMQVQKIKV